MRLQTITAAMLKTGWEVVCPIDLIFRYSLKMNGNELHRVRKLIRRVQEASDQMKFGYYQKAKSLKVDDIVSHFHSYITSNYLSNVLVVTSQQNI